jgi:hypothetical protein
MAAEGIEAPALVTGRTMTRLTAEVPPSAL